MPDGTGAGGNITCGDVVHLALQVTDGIITDARFRAQGCVTSIASADLLCEILTGISLTAAQMLDTAALARGLGGIPADRTNCAAVVLDALRSALEQIRTQPLPAGSG